MKDDIGTALVKIKEVLFHRRPKRALDCNNYCIFDI